MSGGIHFMRGIEDVGSRVQTAPAVLRGRSSGSVATQTSPVFGSLCVVHLASAIAFAAVLEAAYFPAARVGPVG